MSDAHETPDPEPAVEDGAMTPVATAGTDEEEAAPVDEAVQEAEAILESDLDALVRERDEFRAIAQQLQADFENYRKRVLRQQTEHLERAGEALIEKLLPVLDACEAAIGHGAQDVEPIFTTLLGVLEKEGLETVSGFGATFDPNVHEAVMHEEGEGDGEATVVEVFRTGYVFKGRVLRPAMVKVSG